MRDLSIDDFREIYLNQFNDYIYDAERNRVLLATGMLITSDSVEAHNYVKGIKYFYPETESEIELREGQYFFLSQVNGIKYKYVAFGDYQGNSKHAEIIGITEEGEIIPIRSYGGYGSLSPDGVWLAIDIFSGGSEIFSIQDEHSYELSDFDIRRVVWHPNSKIVFFSTQYDELFYYDFMNGVLERIDLMVDGVYPFAWIP